MGGYRRRLGKGMRHGCARKEATDFGEPGCVWMMEMLGWFIHWLLSGGLAWWWRISGDCVADEHADGSPAEQCR
jgi:hypothetical protein